MDDDALAPCGARAWGAMVWTVKDEHDLVTFKSAFQQSAKLQFREFIQLLMYNCTWSEISRSQDNWVITLAADALALCTALHQQPKYWPGACLNIKTVFLGMGIPFIKILWLWDHLIFIMGIPTMVRRHLFIETGHKASNCNSFPNIISGICLPWLSVRLQQLHC